MKLSRIIIRFGCIASALITALAASAMPLPGDSSAKLAASDTVIPDIGNQLPEPVRPEAVPDTMKWFASNERMSLYADEMNGDFLVWDSLTGHVWRSNPDPSTPMDESITGRDKFRAFSQMILKTVVFDEITSSLLAEDISVSRTGSATQLGVTTESIRGGVKIRYEFPMTEITFPMYVTLTPEGVAVTIKTDEIEEKGQNRVVWFSLAPYLASGGPQDNGYLFVPDGSGALIDFNRNKSKYSPYHQAVYGEDPVFLGETRPPVTQKIHLPVFGAKVNDFSCIGIITQGDAAAYIDAQSAMMYNEWNNVYATFQLYGTDTVVIGKSAGGSARDVAKYNFKNKLCEIAQVRYIFSDKGQNEYSHMADLYRNYLINEEGFQSAGQDDTEFPLYINLFGGFRKTESFMGIQTRRYRPATTYKQVEQIIKDLRSDGVEDIVLVYSNWSKDEASGTMPNQFRPAPQLGGKDGLSRLNTVVNDYGVDFYIAFDPFQSYKSSFGFSHMFDIARRLGGQPLRLLRYSKACLIAADNQPPVVLPVPGRLARIASSFTSGAKKANIDGFYLPTLGNMAYTDYSKKNFTSRQSALDTVRSALESMGQRQVANAANQYALPFISHVIDAPAQSSGFKLFDRDIPFYQLVVSRFVPCSTPCVNSGGSLSDMTLFSIETGSGLYFEWAYGNPEIFMQTRYDTLYGAHYEAWAESAVNAYKTVRDAFGQIGSRVLNENRRLTDEVAISTFDSGKAVIVNYGDVPYIYNGHEVDAHDWLVVEEG